jgi:hypothetical protein
VVITTRVTFSRSTTSATARSRDNFPNPYVPDNSPAISDLFELFNFNVGRQGGACFLFI